jgi:hypothetical protein
MLRYSPEQLQGLAENAKILAADPGADLIPVARLFHSMCSWSWLLLARNPDEPQVAYGIADLGTGSVEIGLIDLEEVRQIPSVIGTGVQVDRWWSPGARASGYLANAASTGRLDGGFKDSQVVELLRRGREAAGAAFRMTADRRAAFEKLLALGAPAYDHRGCDGTQFIIGGELRNDDDVYYADYDRSVIRTRNGLRPDVNDILEQHKLRAVWLDAGSCGVYCQKI